ncbi:hypothetical protein PVOR_30063 [Paenibacillus vortex V453]|jgi:hypothetical protein|uniref:SH3b domain-containing protein n=2 Tax=Paenibacillus TaxID=44249 RepID=A0A163HCU2_9BACL|nr:MULTISPECIES: hypothetical protein [Paenibacillus]MBK1678743.1 hypothetical protein [Rhodospirillum rubrum]ANA79482.1 hypothetical protein A3958_05555 [Paenibacillus glucanolyticus]AVV56569.1 hypothetical protein C7121_10750 [Paenibacillus glucanolyticus]AWP25735.1 hypothetical protein B9D94_03425 [Paenibacillus sp. Cedars]EFU38341.1 hypothetical protein PVOR_30063 [Paenibacillus vortex V453]
MKKTLSITAALALTLSLTAVASADPISGTVSDTTAPAPISVEEPIIKPEEVVLVPTPMIELTERTYFYNAPNGQKLGALGAQKIDTTGNRQDVVFGGEWVEVYTWLGKAWIYVE